MRWIRLYLVLMTARLRAQLTYRRSFALDLLSSVGIAALDIVAIFVVFANVPTVGGWSRPQVALLYGVSAVAFSLAELGVGQLGHLSRFIREGTFDLLLLRPGGSLFQLSTLDFALQRIGRGLAGMAVLTYALVELDVHWTFERIALLAVAIPSGAAIFMGVWVAASGIVFWTVDGKETTNAVTYGGHLLTQFPFTIYPLAVKLVFTFLFPLALVAYAPVDTVLEHPDRGWLSGWFAPPAAVLVVLASRSVWRACERRYRSVGG